jgi:glycosyltransferase involved in cell wall biosynthesis
MLLGKGSLELRERLIELHPDLSQSVRATGTLSAADISRHVSACDVMLQPYQDGVSGRRTSVMTALAHGIPVVTTTGKATEKCWAKSQAVKLTELGDVRGMVDIAKELSRDGRERAHLRITGQALYRERFALDRTITTLRETA